MPQTLQSADDGECLDYAKQVALLFVLMSGCKKSDYRKVFKELLEILRTCLDKLLVTADLLPLNHSANSSYDHSLGLQLNYQLDHQLV